jgi:hypothetical protein
VAAFAVAVAGFAATPAGAQDHPSFDIPLDTVIRGDEGSEHVVETATVPEEDLGRGCEVVVAGENNDSVHPNNDIIVESGGSSVEALDVEREPEAVTEATGTLTLGEEITVSVRLGSDEVFSGGLMVTVDCPIPPTPTTSTTSTTTTVPEAPTPAPAPPAMPVPGQPTYTG